MTHVRTQIRNAVYTAFETMALPKVRSRGRLYRYQDQDLPAINVVTFSYEVRDDRVHGNEAHHYYQQTVTVELHALVEDDFENKLDELELDFRQQMANVSLPGVEIQEVSGDLQPVKDEKPQGIRAINYNFFFWADAHNPVTFLD